MGDFLSVHVADGIVDFLCPHCFEALELEGYQLGYYYSPSERIFTCPTCGDKFSVDTNVVALHTVAKEDKMAKKLLVDYGYLILSESDVNNSHEIACPYCNTPFGIIIEDTSCVGTNRIECPACKKYFKLTIHLVTTTEKDK